MISYYDGFTREDAEKRILAGTKAIGTTIQIYSLHGINLDEEQTFLAEGDTFLCWEHDDGFDFESEEDRGEFNRLINIFGSKEVRQTYSAQIKALWDKRVKQEEQ